MTYTDQEIEAAIEAIADRAQNKAVTVRQALDMLRTNLFALAVPAGAKFLFGADQPASALGDAGDVYDNTLTGDRYSKQPDGTWLFQYRAKGEAGVTPVKGRDYTDGYTPVKGRDYRDGVDGKSTYQLWLDAGNTGSVAVFLASLAGGGPGPAGQDGTIWHLQHYDPTPTDGADGDFWQTTVSLSTERRFQKVAGVWRKFYDNTAVAPPANQLPIANAGADLTITLPTSSVQLLGSGTDADGTITSQQWSQVTGPNTAVLATASLLNTAASGLVAGLYQFRLTVTDNAGGSKSDDVVVTVNAQPAPTISSFAPGSGPVGTSVLVMGTGFGASQGSSTLTVNGVQVASVASWSDTGVRFAIPAGATTGNITLTTAGGTATSALDFTVQAPASSAPTITGFAPATGGTGAMVRVTGKNFMAATALTLNGAAITTYAINNTGTQVTFTVPAGAATGPITVITQVGSATTSQAFVVQASSTNPVVTPNASNLQFNTLNQVDSQGHPQFSVLSEYVEDMDATSVIVRVRTGLRGSLASTIPLDEASVGIYLDGQFLTYLAPAADRVSQDFTVALPGTGIRRLRVVNGNAVRPNDAGDILGTIVELLFRLVPRTRHYSG